MNKLLKLVLITTETTHHRYYAWKLNELFPLQAIFVETQIQRPSFETFHPFEVLRDAYERDVLLANFADTFEHLTETYRVESANDAKAVSILRDLSPDVVIVFGTGRLSTPVFKIPSIATLNLHGGNPERYRGLDTHLWAIYHEDFDNLVTTLHHIDEELDTGDIVLQASLNLTRNSKLHELRAVSTKTCVDLSLRALQSLQTIGSMPSRKQVRHGSYCSFMPTALKEECLEKFNQYVTQL